MRRQHRFVRAEARAGLGLAGAFTPFLVAAPLLVAGLLGVAAWEAGAWRPAALAVVLVGGTLPFNAILVRGWWRRLRARG